MPTPDQLDPTTLGSIIAVQVWQLHQIVQIKREIAILNADHGRKPRRRSLRTLLFAALPWITLLIPIVIILASRLSA